MSALLALLLAILLMIIPSIESMTVSVKSPAEMDVAAIAGQMLSRSDEEWISPGEDEDDEEALAAFMKAQEGRPELSMQPLALLGTQRQEEMNYCFLCTIQEESPSGVSMKYTFGTVSKNTVYKGYALDGSPEVDYSYKTSMNTYISEMLREGYLVYYMSGYYDYLLERPAENCFLLNRVQLKEAAAYGVGELLVGTYSMLDGTVRFSAGEIRGLPELAGTVRGEGTTVLDGVTYTFKKADKPKTYDIYVRLNGLRYSFEDLGEDFEAMLDSSMQAGYAGFLLGDEVYCLIPDGQITVVYRVCDREPSMIYTCMTLDVREPGSVVNDAFIAAALRAAVLGDGSFSDNGKPYTASIRDGDLLIQEAGGEEFGRMSPYTVLRDGSEDYVPYELKQIINYSVSFLDTYDFFSREASFLYPLPLLDENGEYVYDSEGELCSADSKITIMQQENDAYIIQVSQNERSDGPYYALVFVTADSRGQATITSIVPLDAANRNGTA